MAKIFYLHWHQQELEVLVEPLRGAGHEVRAHWSTQEPPKWGDYLPDAVVISLERLPSHGRAVAEWIWEAKKRRTLPILFAGGETDKVKVTKERFPKALFCATGDVPEVLPKVLRSVPVPTLTMTKRKSKKPPRKKAPAEPNSRCCP